MALKTNDKRIRLTIRMNEDLFMFVKENADTLGVSPSEYIRLALNSAKSISEKSQSTIGGLGRENDKTDKLHKLEF